MDPELRGGKTPYSEARVFLPLKPLPFPARLRGVPLRTPGFFRKVDWSQGRGVRGGKTLASE